MNKTKLKTIIPTPVWYILRAVNCLRFNLKKAFLRKFASDSLYLKFVFKSRFGYKPDFKNPHTFNEKMNYLKLYCRRPEFSMMVDKYAVKAYVAERIGNEYVVPVLGVWDKFSDIDFDSLPNQFVLKCTHDSGGNIICKDKKSLDKKAAEWKIKKCLKKDFYKQSKEWPYKNVQHRIIADTFLDDHTGNELRDYKFWCFNGKPVYMYCTIKGDHIFENFYDMNFTPVNINHGFPRYEPEFLKPANFDLMRKLAEKLSEDIPFVRIDFFDVDGKVYFAEFTFYDWGGVRPFKDGWDEKLGKLLKI